MRLVSRRNFLGLAAGGVLAACGSGSGGSASDDADKPAAMISYFPDGIYTAGRRERLPFGLSSAEGVPLSSGLPSQLEAIVANDAGEQVARLTAPMRNEGLPRAYYPFDVELPDAGIYTLTTNVEGAPLEAKFSLAAPGTLTFPGPGDPLPPFDTPTTADARGVNPLCTRPEACPFHTQTLTEALAAGGPVAYMVGTPAHCQIGICGPVLDLLVDASGDFPEVTYVHAEVFADDDATTPAPAVTALGLQYEPLLFLVGADGRVQRRLDVIYDVGELRDALSALGA